MPHRIILVQELKWVRDQYYGPTALELIMPHAPPPLLAPAHQTFALGLMTTGIEPNSHYLLHHSNLALPPAMAFVPETRLHWYVQTTNWIVHFYGLPQVHFHWDKIFTALGWITAH